MMSGNRTPRLTIAVRRGRRARETGTALLMAVVLVAAMSIGGAAVWHYLHRTLAETKALENAQITLHLAEAGLETAIAKLRAQPEDYRGEANAPLGPGRFSVTVQPQPEAGAYRLVSRGELVHGRFVRASTALEGELRLASSGEVVAFHWQERKR